MAQPQGEPQTQDRTIWSAMLTVDVHSTTSTTHAGCDTQALNHDACSSNLSPNKFTFEGTEYPIMAFYTTTSGDKLYVRLNTAVPDGLSRATLHVGATKTYDFADKDKTSSVNVLEWPHGGLSWSDGDTVSVKLTIPPGTPTPTPTAPAPADRPVQLVADSLRRHGRAELPAAVRNLHQAERHLL